MMIEEWIAKQEEKLDQIRDANAIIPYGFEGTSLRESGFYKRGFNACYLELEPLIIKYREALEFYANAKEVILSRYDSDESISNILVFVNTFSYIEANNQKAREALNLTIEDLE